MKNNDDTVYCYPGQLEPEEVIFKISPIGSKRDRYLFEIVDQENEVIDLKELIEDFSLQKIKNIGNEVKILQFIDGTKLYMMCSGETIYIISEELSDILFAKHE